MIEGSLSLKFSEYSPEKLAWAGLPELMRIPRARFDYALEQRRVRFSKNLDRVLREVGFRGAWTAERKGDWHVHGCSTLITQERTGVRWALKFRCPQAELYISNVLSMELDSLRGLFVPNIREHSGFFLQEWVDAAVCTPLHNKVFGAALALSLFFGIEDLHVENIIATDRGLAIIDADCAFVFRRGLHLTHFMSRCGILYPPRADKSNGSINLLADRYSRKKVLHGFAIALESLFDTYKDAHWGRLGEMRCRRVIAPTSLYMQLLRRRYLYEETEDELYSSLARTASIRHIPPSILNAEFYALMNWNIPYFYQLGELLISDVDDVVIKHVPPITLSWKRRIQRLIKQRRTLVAACEEALHNFETAGRPESSCFRVRI